MCPSCDACWAGAEGRRQPPKAADAGDGVYGSIFWPWVGTGYRPGCVCIVSLNINAAEPEWWSIAEEYGVASEIARAFAAGERHVFGSHFTWRMLTTASAVLASLDGHDPSEELGGPEQGMTVLERISRVQAVKCAPLYERSKPTDAMRSRCPSRFAVPELGVLDPGVLVALGNDAYEAVEALDDGGVDWTEQGAGFWRGVLRLPKRQADVLSLPHPTAYGSSWADGQAKLVASLSARPPQAAATR